MEEALKRIASTTVEPKEKIVILCVRSQFFYLYGVWNWELNSAVVYCSDVMSFPEDVVGAKGIVHPDDLPKLTAALNVMQEKEIPRLDFRIITTYGEVKTISGQRVSFELPEKQLTEPVPGKEIWQEALEQIALQKENDFLQLQKELAEFSERMNHAGSWLMNKTTGQVWYSDNVFRLYDLAPQSLNAHANTFNSFIHPEDRMAVEDAFEKAYVQELPLHIEYRIVLTGGKVEYLQQVTKWIHNCKGQVLFSGMVRNVSAERAVADELFAAQLQTNFYQHVINFSERQWATGYWHINLITKKTGFSENYSRLYGMKHSSIPNYNAFLNLVHAEDRKKVRDLIDTMYREHVLPETEFRIVRPDGKIRFLKQSGKLHINAHKEFTMIGAVQDVTVQKTLEKKIKELTETVALNSIAIKMGEQFASISFITWLPDGYMQWSDGFYQLLGYKTSAVEPLPKILYKSIHPSDLKIFKNAEALILNNQEHEPINIRIVSKSGIRNLQITFQRLEAGKEHTVALVQDLTMQLALQKEHAENKLLAHLIANAVKDIVFFTNTENIIISWSKEAEVKTGISKEDALYCNLFDVFPRLNQEHYLDQLNAANKGKQTPSLRAGNGYIRQPYDYWLCPLKDEKETVIGVLHVVHDVSEHLLLHQQLSERLNFIESLVESSIDRIVVLDNFMNYIYWNPKAEDYYSIKKERILGKNILEVFPSFHNHPGYNEFRKVLKGETVHLPASVNEETDEYSETYLIPVKEESGKVSAVLWIVHDLSNEYQLQRKKREADEKIKEQAHYLQRITETTPDMISVMELETRKFTFLNPEMFKEQGFDASRLAQNSPEENTLLVHPRDRAAVENYFQKFASASESDIFNVEYRAQSAQGKWNWYLVRGRIFQKDEEGRATHILNAVENITERKEAEQQVLQLKDALTKKATDKYLTLFNSIDEGFYIIELIYNKNGKAVDYRFLEINQSFERHTGIKNAVGKLGSEIAPTIEDVWFKAYDKVLQTKQPIRFEDYNTLTGRWYSAFAFPEGDVEENRVAVLFNDITEQMNAKKKIEESEKRLQLSLEAGNMGTFVWLAQQDKGEPDERMLALFGLTKKDKLNLEEALAKMIHPDDRPHYAEAVDKATDPNGSGELRNDIRVIYPDGSVHWLSIYGQTIFESGVAVHMSGMAVDITERKKNEEQKSFLLKLNDALHPLSNSFSIQQAATEIAMNFFNANRCYYCEIEKDEAIIRRDAFTNGLPSVAGVYSLNNFAIFKAVVDAGRSIMVQDVRTTTLIGEPLKLLCLQLQVISFLGVPVIKHDKVVGVLCLAQSQPRAWTEMEVQLATETAERTWMAVEKAKAEEALQKSEEKYHTLFTNIDEGFVICELLYDENGKAYDLRVMETNQRFNEMMQITDAAGKTGKEILSNAEESWLEIYYEVVTTGKAVRFENYLQELDRWFALYISRIGDDGGRTLAIVFNDITESKDRNKSLKKLVEQRTAELKESRDLLFGIIDAPNVGLAVYKAVRDNKGKIIDFVHEFINKRTRAALGKDMNGKLLTDHGKDGIDQLPKFIETIETGKPNNYIRHAQFNGEDHWILFSNAALDQERIVHIWEDITQLKKADQELQKQFTLLKYTEYLAQSGSWDYEIATGNFSWSEGMYKLFGLPQHMNVYPETYLNHTIEEDRNIAKKIVNAFRKKHHPFEEVLRIKRNGEMRTLKIKGSVIHDENGNPQKIIGVDLDITDIQKAEEQLKESRHWLEQMSKASPDSITVYDLKKKQPVYLNNCLAEWMGISNDDLMNMGIEGRLQLIHPDDRLYLLHNNEKTAAAGDGDVINTEYRITTKKGETIWLRNRSKPFQRDASGKVTHILSILQNVTQEVELREELKQRTRYAESIIDASIDRIAVYDKELRIIAWNKRSEEVTGRKKEHSVGQKLFEIFPRIAQDEELLKAHLDALEGNYVSLPAKKGVYTNNYYERFYIPLKNERKEVYAVINIMHDVSEMVNRNEELKALNQSLQWKNSELEQKNEELTHFSFVASHDMKEPLRKIRTFSDWLIEQENPRLSPKGQSTVEKINSSVLRMEMLIEDILVLTKIHSDTRIDEDVDLNLVLKQALHEMAATLRQTRAEVEYNELPVINGNTGQLFDLFKNLIENAIKFQNAGNVPYVKIAAEIVSGEETGITNAFDKYGKISFTDNGFGFDQRYAKKIFQIFQRLHGRNEFDGAGIGLTICKKIMDNHKGIITVESQLGIGTTFSCYFPLQ